jgi:hypothetical protein
MIHKAHFREKLHSGDKRTKGGITGRIVAAIAHWHAGSKKTGPRPFSSRNRCRVRACRAGFPARLVKCAGGAANLYGKLLILKPWPGTISPHSVYLYYPCSGQVAHIFPGRDTKWGRVRHSGDRTWIRRALNGTGMLLPGGYSVPHERNYYHRSGTRRSGRQQFNPEAGSLYPQTLYCHGPVPAFL